MQSWKHKAGNGVIWVLLIGICLAVVLAVLFELLLLLLGPVGVHIEL